MPDTDFTSGLMATTPGTSDIAGDVFGALGKSLMTSPGNDPFKNFGSALQSGNAGRTADEKKRLLIQALRGKGYSDQQIQTYLTNPQLASLMLGGSSSDTDADVMSGTPNMGAVTPGAGLSAGGGPDLSFGLSPLKNLFGGL